MSWLKDVEQIMKDAKFQLLVAATVLLCFKQISETSWLIIALTYTGVTLSMDLITQLINKMRGA